MTLISPQLTRIPVSLRGDWIRRWNRNIWEGEISCTEPFVTLIVACVEEDLFWAKSLPSKDNSLEVTLDLFPRPDLEHRLFQLSFSSGSGAFIDNVTANFSAPDYRPDTSVPNQFETGVVVPFDAFNPRLEFSLVCIAKSDVVVRRHYVWRLKPRFLDGMRWPWREILTKGRAGNVARRAAA
jgi:hypothetical protein